MVSRPKMSEQHWPIWIRHFQSASLKSSVRVQMLQGKTGIDPFRVLNRTKRVVEPALITGRKWTPKEAVQQANLSQHCSMLRLCAMFREEEGGWAYARTDSCATRQPHKNGEKLVVLEVQHRKEAARCANAVSQAQQW